MPQAGTTDPGSEAALAAVREGDEAAFAALAERHRPELRVHCYRMLGSLDDAEDLAQETLVRAWRGRRGFAGRSSLRAWLYRIATNACLDAIAARGRRPPSGGAVAGLPSEVPWLQPMPDRLLDEAAPEREGPEAAVAARETIELAFMVAIQHLPPSQRAVLVARDVLGWSARETAEMLGTSVAAANSALQRARATLRRHLPGPAAAPAPGADPSSAERDLLRRYMEATERDDVEALVALMAEDARFSMPPDPYRETGREAIVAAWVRGGFASPGFGRWRCLPTRANRQPAAAGYLLRPGDTAYRAFAIDVLRVEDGRIAEITAFGGEALFAAAGLPAELPA